MYILEAGPGIHAVVHGDTNCFVIEGDDGVTVVDAGYPRTWLMVEKCLAKIEKTPADIRALLITHGHFDHLGFAGLLQSEGVPVWAHEADWPICERPYSYHPQRPRLLYPLAYPGAIPVLAKMVVAGALTVPGVVPDQRLVPDEVVPVPGRPLVIHTPGHTDGACVLYLADRKVLITGDTLVTLDPYSGRRGPRIVSRAATHDGAQAFASVDKLRDLDATYVLPGHGEMWAGGIDAAVEAARVAFLSGS